MRFIHVERRAIKESAEGAGAREVYLIDEPMAAAIGSGLPVSEPTGSMVVDIGGGTTEAAIISLNGAVYFRLCASVVINLTMLSLITYDVILAPDYEATAERIKHEIGAAYPAEEVKEIETEGETFAEGVPRSFSLNSNEILEALQEPQLVLFQPLWLHLSNRHQNLPQIYLSTAWY